jgi:hypothetical protein
LLTLHQPSLGEHLEVMAHGRLGEAERLGQIAHARLAGAGRPDEAQQPQPRGIGEHSQGARQPLGFAVIEGR